MKVLHNWARKGTARAPLTWPLTEVIVSGIPGEKRRYPYKKIAVMRRGRGNGFPSPSLPVEKASSKLRHLLSPSLTPSPALPQRRLSFTLYLESTTSWVLCVFLYQFCQCLYSQQGQASPPRNSFSENKMPNRTIRVNYFREGRGGGMPRLSLEHSGLWSGAERFSRL